ncbi:hypothetical protein L13192_12754 [Pyrenophora tritici-repentis]|nr:hypothetical protein L13192_12754 [Pyrenophora tritici-repentis]
MPVPGNRIVFDEEESYLQCNDIYIRLAFCSRSFSKHLKCRGSSEGSTEDHHSIWALARYTAHLDDEEKYMDEWRKYGPIGVLFDVIASICTPQTRQLLERLQRDEAEAIGVTANIRQLVKPVKTRWNSYFDTFVRAAELHGPIDSYIEFKLKEHSAATAPSRRRKNRELLPAAQPRLYVREGGLSGKDWATITEYI